MRLRSIGTAVALLATVSVASACGGSTDSSASGGKAGSGGNTGGKSGSGGSAGSGATGGAGTGGMGGSSATGGQAGGGGSGGTTSVCGGLAGTPCAADEYCDFPDNSYCGGDDSGGVCVKRPTQCPNDCPGACGCDGQSYCSACEAHKSGVDTTPLCVGDGGAKVCGGSAGVKCAADEWCDFADGCGSAPGATGICQKRPQTCTADCPGVCGCDGKFYCNACSANVAGFDTSNSTSCSSGDAGAGASCSSDWECGSGLKCCYPCGIPGCQNQCMKPEPNGMCPMFP